MKNHSIWSFVPRKLSERLQEARQKKYLQSTILKQKLSQKGKRRLVIAPSWKTLHDKSQSPIYNPYSPLIEVDDKEEDEEDEEPTAPVTIRPKMSKSSKENFLKLMSYDDELTDVEESATANHYPSKSSGIANQNRQYKPSITSNEATNEPTQIDPPIENEITTNFSNKYVPKNLTWTSDRKQVDSSLFKDNEENHFALLVRVGKNKGDNLDYHEGRILLSILKSFKTVMTYIKIKPLDYKQGTVAEIDNENDIQFDETFLSNYLEKPMITSNNQFVTRIHFVAKKPFFWYKKNLQFQRWLSTEKSNWKRIISPRCIVQKSDFLFDATHGLVW
jgi:hypothetical protein